MNPYCRRAVSQAVELARSPRRRARHGPHARTTGRRRHTARSDRVGPRARRRHRRRPRHRPRVRGLRHARDRARARPPPLRREGPFDLILTGRNSVDADTGQVPAELAELLDLPFLTGVRHLALGRQRACTRAASTTTGGCRRSSTCPRSCRARNGSSIPRRSIPPERAAVPAARIRRMTASRARCRTLGQGRIADVGRAGQDDGDHAGAVALARRTARDAGAQRGAGAAGARCAHARRQRARQEPSRLRAPASRSRSCWPSPTAPT